MGKLLEALGSEIHGLIIEAGKAVLAVYETDFAVNTKDDESPITEADRKAHHIIREGLSRIAAAGCSRLPFLSEEGQHTPYPERKKWERYWLVDPLDGTKEFVRQNGEFTVNIALVENGLPAAGWVYVPVSDVLYCGAAGEGAFRLEKAGEKQFQQSFLKQSGGIQPAALRGRTAVSSVLKVVASRSHLNQATKKYIETIQKCLEIPAETVQAGSSLKLCRIAEGSADLYPRFGPTMEWDTAAAHAVCRAAGCSVIDLDTRLEMRYNKEDLRNHHFIAAPASTVSSYLI